MYNIYVCFAHSLNLRDIRAASETSTEYVINREVAFTIEKILFYSNLGLSAQIINEVFKPPCLNNT